MADSVYEQFKVLANRVKDASTQMPFKELWKNASGTVIMKSVFTMERFYRDCQDYLYLFQHCATKSMCEAVIEGMGSVWAKSASPERHPDFMNGSEEAVLAWSAPQPWHPHATVFINHALHDLFGSDLRSHFRHVNKQVGRNSDPSL